jgi:aspartate aminotransferase
MPAGAFYAYPSIRGALDRAGIKMPLEFADRLLKEANLAVVPGEAFGTNDHVRISYATSMGELERGLDRIQKFVEQLG